MTPTNEAAERLMIRALRYLDEQVLASGRFELREPSAVLDAGDQDPPERAVLLIRKALAGRGEMRQRIRAIERQAAERPDWDTALRQRHSFNDGTLFDWAACPSENHAADLHALLAAPSLLQERDRLDLDLLAEIVQKGVPPDALMTPADGPAYDDLYRWWHERWAPVLMRVRARLAATSTATEEPTDD